jgi:hypothetical protein
MKFINELLSRGAKNVTKNQLRTGNQVHPPLYKGRGSCCGMGMNQMDDYLLSLINRVNMGSKAMKGKAKGTPKTSKYSGKGLKLIK